MPQRDKTGPRGKGPRTGRGAGPCKTKTRAKPTSGSGKKAK